MLNYELNLLLFKLFILCFGHFCNSIVSEQQIVYVRGYKVTPSVILINLTTFDLKKNKTKQALLA